MSASEDLESAAGKARGVQGGFQTVAGERSTAAMHRVRSLESRVSNVLAIGLMCALGFALLVWYYSATLRRPAHAAQSAKRAAATRAEGEMALPSLGVILGPALARAPDPASAVPANLPPDHPQSAAAPALALQPEALGNLPIVPGSPGIPSGGWPPPQPQPVAPAANPVKSALDRRLSGPVFARQGDLTGASTPEVAASGAVASAGVAPTLGAIGLGSADSGVAAAPVAGSAAGSAHHGELTEFLMPSATPAVSARVLPTQRLLLPKGAFIDCTLETAIDSTLPGMTTCITATDTFSADGKVVLLERGSKLVGETRGEVQQGSARVFVLWTEARTPTGVVIPLASPGTDELGRSGLAGQVDRHFWERFGAAILISIIDAAAESAIQSASSTIIYSPTTSQDVVAGVLKDTLGIPPTVVKNQGDRIQILVARDLDFRSVYELRTQAER